MKRLLLIAVLGLTCSSCAFMNRRNLPLVNLHREYLVPDNTTVKWVMSPVWAPIGLVAGVTDVALVHPVSVMDDAAFQTAATVWAPSGSGWVAEGALFPLRVAATPPHWAMGWLGRSIFAVPRWPPSAARLKQDLQDDDAELRMLALQGLAVHTYSGDDIEAVSNVMIDACKARANDDVGLCEAVIARLPQPLTTAGHAYLAELARTGHGRLCAAAIVRLFRACLYRSPLRRETPEADRALKTLTDVYDALVLAGHREAELTVSILAGEYAQRQHPRALAMYVARSLARRNWPLYGEATALFVQARLLQVSPGALIEAISNEWRALRVHRTWRGSVKQAVARLQSKQGGASLRASLTRLQNDKSKRLRTIGPGRSLELLRLTEELIDVKTMLDAEEIAERLVKGPPEDLRLFMGNPIKLLRAKGGP